MLCHLGAWDKVADTCSASHITCSKLTKTHCIIDKSGVGTVGQTSSKNSDFANQKNIFMGVAAYWVVSVNLISGRIVTDKA